MARFFNLTETLPLAAIKPGELIPFPMLDRQAGPRYRIRDITGAALGPPTPKNPPNSISSSPARSSIRPGPEGPRANVSW